MAYKVCRCTTSTRPLRKRHKQGAGLLLDNHDELLQESCCRLQLYC